VAWIEASGKATLYTWSTVHINDLAPFNERVPYIAAVVDLAEGPRVMTNLIECDGADLAIGMPLEVRFQEIADGITAPVFIPSN
jgi:uncharacterized protein